jgi:acyl-coenzyme A thioesterase PaaI-like protein
MEGTESRVSEFSAANGMSFQQGGHAGEEQGVGLMADSGLPAAAQSAKMAPGSETLNPECFVCGGKNPNGLRLDFQADGQRASATWTARAGWESYKGVIHGGILSSVLDEAMAKAIISGGDQGFTADLRIRFRKKVSVDEVVFVNGWVVSAEKRRIMAEASITSADGEEKAHAWGVFLTARHS